VTALTNTSLLLDELNQRHVSYQVQIARSDAIMVSVAIPGERWEIEFFDDGHIELERFISNGVEEIDDATARILSYYDS
jgi:hypothetical protein